MKKMVAGLIIGSMSGLVSLAILSFCNSMVVSFVSDYPNNSNFLGIVRYSLIVTWISTAMLALPAIIVGAIVGASNGLTEGGIARGLEWVFIAGIGSSFACSLPFDFNCLNFSVGSGLLAGLVGYVTWFAFRPKKKKAIGREILLPTYILSFVLIALSNTLLLTLSLLAFED